MANKKYLLKIGIAMGVFVLLLVGLSLPKHAQAICAGPDPCGTGTIPTAAPTLNIVQAVSGSQVYFAWTNVDGGVGTYYIYQSTDNITFSVVASTTALTYNLYSSYIPASCVGGSGYKYYYRIVQTVSGQKVSNPSNVLSPVFMCSPTIQSVTTVSQTQLNTYWTDNSDNEAGFYVYRDGIYVGAVAASAGTGATLGFGDAAFTCGTTHSYYIVAYNGSHLSNNSATLSGTTSPCVVPPTAPTINYSSATSQNSVSFTYTSTSVIDFLYLYRDGVLFASAPQSGVNGSQFTSVDSGLACGSTHSYFVRVANGGYTADSVTFYITTNACVSAPAAVSAPIVTPVAGNPSANTSWSGTFGGTRVYLKGPSGYTLAGDFASAIKSTSLAGLRCPYPYVAYYVAYNTDPTVVGTDASCSSALSNAGISGPAAPTGAKCAAATQAPVNMSFCTQQFLGK